MENNQEKRERFFAELAIALRSSGFNVSPAEDGMLSVERDRRAICQITGGGGIQFKPEELDTLELQRDCALVTEITDETKEYMDIMERAPVLKASGLGENYKLLAEFKDTVLAGHPSKYGVQFVTWDWGYDRTSLCQGHYLTRDYRAAKQDFVIRSGLVPKEIYFEPEQLLDIHHALVFTREQDESLSFGQDQALSDIVAQVERLALENGLRQRGSPEQGGMTMTMK